MNLFIIFPAIFLIYKSFKLNLYLALLQLFFVLNIYVNTNKNYELDYSVVFGMYLSILMSIFVTSYFIKDSRFNLNNLHKKSISQCYLVSIILLPFYLLLSGHLYSNPWWSTDESRNFYMQNFSILLRGIKLTPILILMFLFFDSPKKFRIFKCSLLIGIFSIFFGSKSGIFFLFIGITWLFSIYKVSAKRKLELYGFVLILLILFSGYFFWNISNEHGIGIFSALSDRLSSDFVAYERILDVNYLHKCTEYNFLNPLILFFQKISGSISSVNGHLSYGHCIASPEDQNYKYEFLIPLFFELKGVYGLITGSIILFSSIFLMLILYKSLGFLGNFFRINYIGICSQIYFSFQMLQVIFYGKLVNVIVSEYFSIIAFLFFASLTHNFLKLIKLNILKFKTNVK